MLAKLAQGSFNFFKNNSFSKQPSKNSGSENLKQNDSDESFINFNLELSSEEKKCLQAISIKNFESYTNYGELDSLESELQVYLRSLGEENNELAATAAKIIATLISKTIKTFEQETAWIVIRAFMPNPFFNLARWHRDGYYYSPHTGDQYKAAITLKGPSTLFYKLTPQERTQFLQHQNDREKLAALFDKSKAISAEFGEGSAFIVGSDDHAAMHSEPTISTERLFLGILPGSMAQIKEWHDTCKENEKSINQMKM